MSATSDPSTSNAVILLNNPSVGDFKATVDERPGYDFPPQIVHFRESSEMVEYGHDIQDQAERNDQFVPTISSLTDPILVHRHLAAYLNHYHNFLNRWGPERLPLGQREIMNTLETSLGRNVTEFPPQFGLSNFEESGTPNVNIF